MGSASYVYLWRIGKSGPQEDVLEDVRAHTESLFGLPVRIRRKPPSLPDVFDPARGQFSSTKILRAILQDMPADARKLLAISDGDLFIPVLTFVFGEAQLGGPAAVVSIARLRVDPVGQPCPAALFRARLVKECTHELGHTFGLAHCSSARCVMSRSNTIPEVDSKSAALCRDCRRLFEELESKQE